VLVVFSLCERKNDQQEQERHRIDPIIEADSR